MTENWGRNGCGELHSDEALRGEGKRGSEERVFCRDLVGIGLSRIFGQSLEEEGHR